MNPIAVQFYKETRELLPWWLGGVGAMLASGFAAQASSRMGHTDFLSFGAVVFVATACGLGGLAIGHEYSHRTLAGLLAQPGRRAVLLGIKLFSLASLLSGLAVVAFFVLGEGAWPGGHPSGVIDWRIIIGAVGCGFFLAPWLSMVGRGPLPGTIFAVALPFAVMVLLLFGMSRFEALFVAIRLVGVNPWEIVLVTLWAIGGVLTWTTFLRLQALDGTGAQIRLPAWLVTRPMEADPAEVRTRHAGWLIVNKELRLQQLAFVIAAIYVGLWAAFVSAGSDTTAGQFTYFYVFVIPIIVGAPASAEERRLGTASWQAMLPIASAWQWALKVATAMALTVVLTAGLPLLLSQVAGPAFEVERGMLEGAVCLCILSLYISSVSSNGIRAVLASALAIVGVIAIGAGVFTTVIQPGIRMLEPLAQRITPFALTRAELAAWRQWATWLQHIAALGGGAALLLRFGAANHQSDDLSGSRIGRQIAWIVGYLAATLLATSFFEQLLWAGLKR